MNEPHTYREGFTADQNEAVGILEKQPASPERDLLIFLISDICAVACGDDEGCFYCKGNHEALKSFLGAQTTLER